VPGGREPGHVRADLGEQQMRGGLADPGDLIQPLDRRRERGDQLGKLGVEVGEVGVQRVGPAQHLGEQEGVLVGEEPGERLRQRAEFGARPGTGQLREDLGVALSGDQRGQHGPPGDPEDVAGHHREFDLGVLQQLLHPLLLRGPRRHQIGSVAGHVPQLPDRSWWDEAGPQHLPLGELAQPDRVQRVGLGTSREVLDVTGVDQPGLEPVGFQQVVRPPSRSRWWPPSPPGSRPAPAAGRP
jgi:hypothetical protein